MMKKNPEKTSPTFSNWRNSVGSKLNLSTIGTNNKFEFKIFEDSPDFKKKIKFKEQYQT